MLAALDRADSRARSTTRRGSPPCGRSGPRRRRAFFARLAPEWDRIRSLHVAGGGGRGGGARGPRAAADPRSRSTSAPAPAGCCSSSRRAPPAPSALDASHAMLSVARANLEKAGLTRHRAAPGRHLRAAVPAQRLRSRRHPPGAALSSTIRRGRSARRRASSRRAGRILVVDFAPHRLEFLREAQAHRRLGFAAEQVAGWLAEAGLDCALTRELAPPDARRRPAHRLALARPGSPRRHRLAAAPAAIERLPDVHRRIPPEPHGTRPVRVSFEFFPPKTPEMEATLWSSIERLAPLAPNFVSVTYGAGGSTRERTHATVARLVRETPAEARRAPHLRRGDAGRGRRGRPLLLGRGRAPRRGAARRSGRRRRQRLRAASRRLRSRPAISSPASSASAISRSRSPAYPEKHPGGGLARGRHRRAEAQGRLRRRPGHHPVLLRQRSLLPLPRPRPRARHRPSRSCRASCRCRTSSRRRTSPGAPARACPTGWRHRFEGLDDDIETRRLIAAAVAAEQVIDLVDRGVTEFHFYTMNRADLVYAICHLLGLRATRRRRLARWRRSRVAEGGCAEQRAVSARLRVRERQQALLRSEPNV